MIVTNDIQHKKELFDLPYHKDQLEYWGPITPALADSFLTMGNTFIYQYFSNLDSTYLKSVFSSLVVMVQNVSQYAENSSGGVENQVFFRVKDDGQHILITTVNRITAKYMLSVKSVFDRIFAIPEQELDAEHKKMLFTGGGLGLIKLRKLKGKTLEYSFLEKKEGQIWLEIELKLNYGNT